MMGRSNPTHQHLFGLMNDGVGGAGGSFVVFAADNTLRQGSSWFFLVDHCWLF